MARSRPAFARPLPLWRPPLPPSLPVTRLTHSHSLSPTALVPRAKDRARVSLLPARATHKIFPDELGRRRRLNCKAETES